MILGHIQPWVQNVRTVQIALYGLLFGLSFYLFINAVREYHRKNDKFNGAMWLTVCWVEGGLVMVALVGFTVRYQLLANHLHPDMRLWATPLAQVPVLVGQLLAFRLIRHARKGGATT